MKSLRKSSKCRKAGNLNNVNQTESEFVSLALKGGGNNFSEIGPFACCILQQANAMAAVIQPMMSGGSAPWLLYGIGAAIALLLTIFKVPALPFCLGMFIPIDLNLPLLVGGAVSWFVGSRSKDASLNSARSDKGTLIASGFIAGGALMGVVSAILKFAKVDWFLSGWNTIAEGRLASGAQAIAIIPYLLLIAYTLIAILRKEKK